MILPVELLGERVEPVDDEAGARAVGLHDDAEAVPAGQRRVGKHRLDDVERQVEPVGLLGVDVETHARALGSQAEAEQALGHHRQHGWPPALRS